MFGQKKRRLSDACHGTDSVQHKIRTKIKSNNNGVGVKCGWNGKTLDCSRKNLERLDGIINIMKVAGLVITENGNIPIKVIKNVDFTGNKLRNIDDVTEMIKVRQYRTGILKRRRFNPTMPTYKSLRFEILDCYKNQNFKKNIRISGKNQNYGESSEFRSKIKV